MKTQGDENPYISQMVNSTDLFKDKRVVLFSLPGFHTNMFHINYQTMITTMSCSRGMVLMKYIVYLLMIVLL